MDFPLRFGDELRRLRHEAGLSLDDLARRVHYSKSHLSKVENGRKEPSDQLARQCDAVLRAHGALRRLGGPVRPHEETPSTEQTPTGKHRHPLAQVTEDWTLTLDGSGAGRLTVVPVDDVSAAEVSHWNASAGGGLSAGTLEGFRAIFGELRRLGQRQSPTLVLPATLAQTHTLRRLATTVSADERPAVLVLAARFAEYAGWCLQEAGDDRAALAWTDRAAHLAAAGGDTQFVAYADVRRALVSLYRHDASQTVALARRAGAAAVDHRIRGLAAQREAQGHALGGDEHSCRRALDQAAEELALAPVPAGTPVVGTSSLSDPAGMARGWCLYDLGQPAEAVRILEQQLGSVPPNALRTRVRFGVRLALAYADAAEPERACAVVTALLEPAVHVDSATVRSDLARLGHLLTRWRREPDVRELLPTLHAVLHVPSIS